MNIFRKKKIIQILLLKFLTLRLLIIVYGIEKTILDFNRLEIF